MKFIVIALVYFTSVLSLYAATFNISATVDRTSLSTSDVLNLTVTLTSSQASLPAFTIPNLADFNILATGSSQRFSFVNGATQNSISHNYVLGPRATGTFSIPSFSISVGGETFSTEPIQIEVAEGAPAPARPQAPARPGAPQGAAAQEGNVFVKAFTDRQTVYVSEPLLFTFQLFTGLNLVSSPTYQAPDFAGFLVDRVEQNSFEQTINGRRFFVSEIQTLLFPQTDGNITIPSANLNASIPDLTSTGTGFFGLLRPSRNVMFKTDPIVINVLPLPKSAQMAGEFTITARTTTDNYQTGEPFNLITTITGSGNVRAMTAPTITASENLRLYQTSSRIIPATSIVNRRASREFTTLIMATEPGEAFIRIEPISYFNTNTRTMRELSAQEFNFTVTGLPLTPAQDAHIGQEMPTAFITPEGTFKINLNYLTKAWGFLKHNLIWFALAGALLVTFKAHSVYIKRLNKDTIKLKSKSAYRRSKKYFQKAKKAKDTKGFYEAMYKGCLEYFASAFKQSAEGLTTYQIKNKMIETRQSPELISAIEDILNECQAMLYSNAKIDLTQSIATRDFYDKTFTLLNKLDI